MESLVNGKESGRARRVGGSSAHVCGSFASGATGLFFSAVLLSSSSYVRGISERGLARRSKEHGGRREHVEVHKDSCAPSHKHTNTRSTHAVQLRRLMSIGRERERLAETVPCARMSGHCDNHSKPVQQRPNSVGFRLGKGEKVSGTSLGVFFSSPSLESTQPTKNFSMEVPETTTLAWFVGEREGGEMGGCGFALAHCETHASCVWCLPFGGQKAATVYRPRKA